MAEKRERRYLSINYLSFEPSAPCTSPVLQCVGPAASYSVAPRCVPTAVAAAQWAPSVGPGTQGVCGTEERKSPLREEFLLLQLPHCQDDHKQLQLASLLFMFNN